MVITSNVIWMERELEQTDTEGGDRLLMYTHVAHVVSATATRMGDGCDMIISYSCKQAYTSNLADERQWVQLFL